MPKFGQQKGTPRRRAELVEYLRGLGPGDECVYWPWSDRREGYASAHIDGRKWKLSRWVYEQVIGPLPPRSGRGATGILVCHTCDNRACIRPSHFFLGSNRVNMQDASRKGRLTQKLTLRDRGLILALYDEGVRQGVLATVFGVSFQTVHYHIKHRPAVSPP